VKLGTWEGIESEEKAGEADQYAAPYKIEHMEFDVGEEVGAEGSPVIMKHPAVDCPHDEEDKEEDTEEGGGNGDYEMELICKRREYHIRLNYNMN